MITQEKRSVVVHYWFEKAEESVRSAKREFEAGSLLSSRLMWRPN